MIDASRRQRLQDYLDDRMTADERLAFEAELARDDELAAEHADAVALGDALRDLDARLPAGFEDRVSARVSTAARGGRRTIPWEAWGLAAAALVLAAVLVPWTMFTGPGPSWTPAPGTMADSRADEAAVPPAGAAPSVAGVDAEPRLDVAPPAEVPPPEAKPGRRESVVPTPAPAMDADADRGEPARQPEPSAEPRHVREPSATAGTEPRREKGAASRERQRSTFDAAPVGAAEFDTARTDAGRATAVAVASDRLPAGLDRHRIVGVDEATWSDLLSGPSGAALVAVAPRRPTEGVGLVLGPADCSAVRVARDAGTLIVVVPAGPDEACAVALPETDAPRRVVRTEGP